MALIPDAYSEVNDVEVAQDAPDTEALWNKIGADINYLLHHMDTAESNISTLQTDVSALQAAQSLVVKTNFSWTGTSGGSFVTLATYGSVIWFVSLYLTSPATGWWYFNEAGGNEQETTSTGFGAGGSNTFRIIGNQIQQRTLLGGPGVSTPILGYAVIFYSA